MPETLTVKWQPTNDRFLFVAKSGTDTETEILTYNDVPLADSVQAKGFLKDLRINNSVVNCTGGPVEASMDARFDNVRLNATAVGALAD